MKDLINYIKEHICTACAERKLRLCTTCVEQTLHLFEDLNDDNSIVLQNLQATYKGPESLFIQVPKTYSESDVQIYLDDVLLKQMPGSQDQESTKLFGDNNVKNINDAHFEYDEMSEVSSSTQVFDIAWDKNYDTNIKDDELQVVYIKNIRYIIVFTQFELISVTTDTYEDKLNDIFENTLSDNYKYPFNITLNTDDLIYELK